MPRATNKSPKKNVSRKRKVDNVLSDDSKTFDNETPENFEEAETQEDANIGTEPLNITVDPVVYGFMEGLEGPEGPEDPESSCKTGLEGVGPVVDLQISRPSDNIEVPAEWPCGDNLFKSIVDISHAFNLSVDVENMCSKFHHGAKISMGHFGFENHDFAILSLLDGCTDGGSITEKGASMLIKIYQDASKREG